MVEIKEHSFLVSDVVPYPANLKIIGVKDLSSIPGIIDKGDIYNLEDLTIEFTPIDENNYSWQKPNLLLWEDDYSGDVLDVSWTDYGMYYQSFNAPEIEFPFSFPYFNFNHNKCMFFGDGSIVFENKNGLPPPEGMPQLYDLEGMKHYLPRILGFGTLITLTESGKVYVKTTSDSILITYISDDIVETPNVKLELQYKLWESGNIRVSIKTLCYPQMSRNAIGLLAGISEELFPADFYNQESGQTNNSFPTGQIQFLRQPNISLTKFAKFIQENYPNAVYDGVFVIPDFPLQFNDTNFLAMCQILYNDIFGTGYDLVDTDFDNFDASRLQSVICLPTIDKLNIDPEIPFHPITTFHHFTAHEWGHKWIQHLAFWNDGLGHWSNSVNTKTPLATTEDPYHSTLGGFALVLPNQKYDGKFMIVSSDNSPYGYSSVGLYMMGLMSKEDASHISNASGEIKTIDEIVDLIGEDRQPTYEFSKKIFNAMIVYITINNPEEVMQNSSKVELITEYFKKFAEYFRTITLGIGRIMYTDWLLLNPTNIITMSGILKSFLKNTTEKISFLINYYASLKDRIKAKEFYKLIVDILRFDPCKIDDCEGNPAYWPIENWFDQLREVDKRDLKKIDKKINDYIPEKEIKRAIEKYQILRKDKLVQKKPIMIGDENLQLQRRSSRFKF